MRRALYVYVCVPPFTKLSYRILARFDLSFKRRRPSRPRRRRRRRRAVMLEREGGLFGGPLWPRYVNARERSPLSLLFHHLLLLLLPSPLPRTRAVLRTPASRVSRHRHNHRRFVDASVSSRLLTTWSRTESAVIARPMDRFVAAPTVVSVVVQRLRVQPG